MRRLSCLLLLCALFILPACTVQPTTPSQQQEEESYWTPAPETSAPPRASWFWAAPESIVMKIGDYAVYGYEYNYYYINGIDAYINSGNDDYVQYLDTSQSLATQYMEDGVTTWQQHFREMIDPNLQRVITFYLSAVDQGIQLTQEELDAKKAYIDNYSEYAENNGMTLDIFLNDSFGGMTSEHLDEVLDRYYLSQRCEDQLYDKLEPTSAAIEDYYQQNKDDPNIADGYAVTVRHIMLSTEEETQQMLSVWEESDMTEETFASLAASYSTDTASARYGGLLEDNVKGYTQSDFDVWCFDPERKQGDYGIVDSGFGSHLVYFVSRGDEAWRVWARSELIQNGYNEYTEQLIETYPLTSYV